MESIVFSFGTKYENLHNLKDSIQSATIPDLIMFRVSEWQANRDRCLEIISKQFINEMIIIRSSAPSEDSIVSSMAGAFTSIAYVSPNNKDAIVKAFEEVLLSYEQIILGELNNFQIIVQKMVKNVVLSGVLFTRDLEKLGPYYVINYEESESTDSVTAGYGRNQKTLRIYKGAVLKDLYLCSVLNAAQEIERITRNDQLDIEFAVDSLGIVNILQVRPLVSNKVMSSKKIDYLIAEEISSIERYLQQIFRKQFGCYGVETILGQMTDWNPAEIIGPHPKPLSYSLYQHLVMSEAWREGRMLLGYRDITPKQLMLNIGGRPYVDIRASFNSLLPSHLPDDFCERLVDFYLKCLKERPELHDKIEFDIVISCLDFEFEKKSEKLLSSGFSVQEVAMFKDALLNLTNNIITDATGMLNELQGRVNQLSKYREHIKKSDIHIDLIPRITEQLLAECIHFGTIPFSSFARCAFIGNAMLRSLKQSGLFTEDRYDSFLRSSGSITSELMKDYNHYSCGEESLEEFLSKYGHLRPGTYDVQSYSYDEKPELYLLTEYKQISPRSQVSRSEEQEYQFNLTSNEIDVISKEITKIGFNYNVDQLFFFIKESLNQREVIKFEFTKNLSLALKLLIIYSEYHGITRDDLAYLEINDLFKFAYTTADGSRIELLKETIRVNKKRYEHQSLMYFPELLSSIEDIKILSTNKRDPNFITQKNIISHKIDFRAGDISFSNDHFVGKIVLIENADPGYDWLFTKKIGGLVTKYGGVASHMAIRCAELGLPAAIGCGVELYTTLQKSTIIQLNCMEKKIQPIGVNYEGSVVTKSYPSDKL